MPSDTPPALRQLVLDRDRGRCQRCGRCIGDGPASLHHRQPRGMGGRVAAHTTANLVTLCGTGVTGCHGWVESHRAVAYEQGWLVHRWDDPALRPVLRFGRTWSQPGDTWTPAPVPTP